MKLILRNSAKNLIKTISFDKFELFQNFISELSAFQNQAEATLITANERITCLELAKFKLNLKKLNINFADIYSTTVVNHTAQQAWQAGFREGVKMSLDRGKKRQPSQFG